jgi:hypothetical protein
VSSPVFELPDTIAALPEMPFEFSPFAADEADVLVSLPPDQLFYRLLRDQESQSTLLASRRVLNAFLPPERLSSTHNDPLPQDADGVSSYVGEVRAELAAIIGSLTVTNAEIRLSLLRERAPLSLIGGCWLDMVSQPATQPAIFVNRLVAQQWELRGEGNQRRSLSTKRRLRLEEAGIYLPEVSAPDFFRQAGARPLTALHACFYIALSRLPANFLPEVVGVNYVFHALGVDDILLGVAPPLAELRLRAVLDEYLAMAPEAARQRLRAAVRLAVSLEREHVGLLAELAAWRQDLSLESKVAEIIARRAPMAGRQHGKTRVGGRPLAELFRDPDLDIGAFMKDFRESPLVQPSHGGTSRFIQAMKFGGPMFGIFDEQESAVFKAWVAGVQSGERPVIEISVNRAGDEKAAHWSDAVARSAPADVVLTEANPRNDRELFYRLVNLENFANTLPIAARRAEDLFTEAEILFKYGAEGKYTDATWFDFSPEALFERGERVYWEKLVDPYEPIVDMPDRDEVIFAQTTYALGSLIDGAWIHRIGNLGHRGRESDEMLYAIYADEMGHGDLRKNHITLVHRVLASMGIKMPHIRDAAFMDQRDLPDDLYGFSLQQLCMCLFPDTFYNEILGYNFAIEMFGSGEFRLHEIQKLRHYGFDDCYEVAHLAIDNFSSGHTRQAADIIVSYLDEVRRTVGEAAVQQEWRRIWRGYASFAWFVEHALVKKLASSTANATGDKAERSGTQLAAGEAGDGEMTELVL